MSPNNLLDAPEERRPLLLPPDRLASVEHDLNERVKELRCLSGIASITIMPDITLDKICQEIANLLPCSWQYPEITCARLTINDKEFKTKNYRKTKWKLSSDILVHGAKAGVAEVSYLEERPVIDEGPFSKEERVLLNTVAEQLAEITELKQAEETLRESEEKYRSLFQVSPVGIAILDMKGIIKVCNPAVYRVGGYSKDELIGKHFTKVAPVRLRDIPKYINTFSSIIRGKVPEPFVVTYTRKDGTTGWTEIHASLLKEGGKKLGVQVIQKDITEQKRAGEAAWQSDEKYRKLFGNMLDGFAYCRILLDEDNQPIDYVHLEVNNAWERLTGLKKEDVIGKRITEVIPGIKKSKTDLISIYGKVALTGKETQFELYFKPLKKWFTVSVYSPQKEYFITAFEDITELKRAKKMASAVALGRPLTPIQERFLKSGTEGFKDREIIELLLLSPGLSPRECKKLAKQVVERFKTLRQLVAASPKELRQAGVTPHGILHIKFVREIATEILRQRIVEQSVYKSPKEIFDYLSYSMRDLKKEVFKVIYLNNRNQIIEVKGLFEGTLESIPIRPREIAEGAIKRSAAALIFAHNHPTGDPTPSKSDKQLTRDLVFIGNILQIKVLDHVIIGENTYFSFADDGLIRKYEENFLNLKMRGVFDIGVGYGKKLPAVFIPLLPAIYLAEETVVGFLSG